MGNGYLMAILTVLSLAMPPQPTDGIDPVSPPLVDPDWLALRLESEGLVVLDIRHSHGDTGRDIYESGHVPGAIYGDYAAGEWRGPRGTDPATRYPVVQLERVLGRLGIGNASRVVIVHGGMDASDFSSAARVYWTFKLVGHQQVSILNGGYRAWRAAGFPVEQGWIEPHPTDFTAQFRDELLATTAQMQMALSKGMQLVDGRGQDFYEATARTLHVSRSGTLPEPRRLSQEHLIDPETGRFIEREALLALLRENGIRPARATVISCDVGHRSASPWFALHAVLGYRNVRLCDASMMHWAASPLRPLVELERSPG